VKAEGGKERYRRGWSVQVGAWGGTRAGLPDLLIIWRGEIVFIELKSRRGIASKVQRQVHDELLAAGVKWWWLAGTPRACLLALHHSGVPLINWRPPRTTEEWEGPFENPHARLPSHPVVAAERAAARKRCRERKRAREPELAAERRYETDFPTSTRGDGELPGTPCCTLRQRSRPDDQLPSQTKFGP
jgi:hypothetical protein